MARAPDFDLATALAKPGFTPAVRDAAALVELVVAGDDRAPVALAGLGEPGRVAIAARLAPAAALDEAGRARLVGALGLLARRGDAAARLDVLAHVTGPEVRVRRAAIAALGKLGGDDARDALLARWDAGDAPPDERRALAEALGMVGGATVRARLHALEPGDDKELARRRDRALLMLDRDAKRGDDSEVRVDLAPPRPLAVRLHVKPGLAPLLVDELRALLIEGRADGDAAVELALAGPWSTLFASRLWATAGIRIPRVADPDPATSITRSITAPVVRDLLRAWTRGPIRWRLQLEEGKQRAVVWRVARDVTVAAPELVNDPTATAWDVLVQDETLELRPRRAADPRFAYRVADLPAASHPSVAAAIAWLSEPRAGDRVWDPFCGSGLELAERAARGPCTLIGSDIDDAALAAARQNVPAALLAKADARTHDPGTVDAILTNPPLGSRVQVDAGALLVAALPNLVRRLAVGGRLVWITPAPKRTTPAAENLGLRRTARHPVDLGGVRGQLERWLVG